MRAVILEGYGPPTRLHVIDDAPAPALRPNDVLIEVHATSVNPIDTKLRAGGQRGIIRLKFPAIIGLDVSGVVTAVGAKVSRFAVGDEVYASPTHRRPGCSAEAIAVDVDAVAHKPKNITHAEAATIPLVGLTAYQCLLPKLREKPGQRVFIAAGAGGVGTFAIQLAKIFEAEVFTTCSARNVAFLKELGADHVIDYGKDDYVDTVTDCDLALESISAAERIRALPILKRGGWMSSITTGLPENTKRFGAFGGLLATGLGMLRFIVAATLQGKVARNVVRTPSGERLAEITKWIEEGRIRPVVGQTFPLTALAEAHTALERGGSRGKIAVVVHPEAVA